MIDLSRLPPPAAIEPLDFETLYAAFGARFRAAWAAARAANPALPDYDVQMLETDPPAIVGQAWSYLRLLDRARVNDAVRALLAHLARGADLDALAAANAGLERLVVTPASGANPAVMETDERLLRRYLASFGRASAGSAALYEFVALTAWPGCHDVAVVGRAVHGRPGDTDVVLAGPNGRAPTQSEILLVRDALRAPGVAPEAVAVTVTAAVITVYDVAMEIDIPRGPDPALVVAEVEARVRAVAAERARIGAEVPVDALTGAVYGPSVIRVRRVSPTADVAGAPYAIPVLGALTVDAQAPA